MCLCFLELAILGCNVSKETIQAVTDIVLKLNLPKNLPVANLPPVEVIRYLTNNHLKFSVLVVDSDTVKVAYTKLSERKTEYEELLKTAADKVGKMDVNSSNERNINAGS